MTCLASAQNLGVFTPQTSLPLTFGASLKDGNYYQGGLDEVSLYTRPLTIAEIVSIYQAGASGKTPPASNILPTVVIASPSPGSAFIANTPVTIGAIATDTDGTIAKVEFFDGATKLGETTTAQVGQPQAFNFTVSAGFALGSHQLTAVATDNAGGVMTSGALFINAVPVLPVVAITAPADSTSLTVGSPLILAATATDAAGTITKVEFFDGAVKLGESTTPTIGSSFSLTVPAGLTIGAHTLTAKATANDGTTAVSAPISVSSLASPPPQVALTSPADGGTIVSNSTLGLTATATSTAGTIAKVEFFNGSTKLGEATVAISGHPSTFTFTLPGGLPVGSYVLTARATDGSGQFTNSAAVNITAINYSGPPVAIISAPADASLLAAPTSVTGIVVNPALASWSLGYRLKAAEGAPVAPWVTFATGTGNVGTPAVGSNSAVPGIMGTFDPTLLINGIYELQLTTTDSGGGVVLTNPITIVVNGNMKVGSFTLAFEDLKVPVSGIPISVVRTYDSRDPRVGDFGPGWRIAVNNIRVQKNRNLGLGWYQTPQSGVGIQFYYVDPVGDRVVTVTMPDGETHRFRGGAVVKKRVGDPDDASFAVVNSDGLYKFYPLDDTTSTLEPIDASGQLDDHFWIQGTGDQDLTTDGSDPFAPTYDPTRFRLTTKDGTVYILDESLGLLELHDLTGNTLVLNRDAQNRVTSMVSTQAAPSGDVVTSVTIHRDATGRVDYIRDPAGNDLDYTYDASGRLETFVNRELNTTQFKYENAAFPYYLTQIIDPRGVPAIRTEFDDSGRMVKQIDADGNATIFTHAIDAAARYDKVTDRLGHATTYYYDDRGNVTLKVDPLGAQTTYSYYPDTDWVKFETDHYGNVKSMAYDARGNVTVQTIGASITEDPVNPTTGHTTRTIYNSQSAPTQITDPDGRVQTFTYDATTNNLLSNTAGSGGSAPATTSYGYNTDGTLATVTDALGNVTNNTYNYSFTSAAYPSAVKQVTVTVTDPAGSAGSDPANAADTILRTSRTLYDAQQNMLAQIATRTLPAGGTEDIVTNYIYDTENRLKATIMPDGKVSETRYTSFGQTDKTLLWKSVADYETGTDSLARVTSYGYDNRGNQTSTTYPDGTSETSHFDLENRRDWSQDKLGRRTSFQYDADGRLRFTIEPDATPCDLTDNPYTETIYDLTGRVTDTYDELRHRSTVVYYADGTPDAGRRKQTILATGYSLLTTSYSYDASGNVRFVTDPRGNTVETQYDDQGRPTIVVYPATDEHPATQSSTKYNLLGQRVETADQEGKVTRYRYDALGRLVEVRQYLDQTAAPLDLSFGLSTLDPRLVSTRYSYDELGHQTSQTDARGNTTSYQYDSLGRRTKRILPDNQFETVQYDEWGNLWKRTDFAGKTTTFAYDLLNRLTSKTADPTHPSLIYSNAIARVEFDYDGAGLRTAARTYSADNTLLYTESTPRDERSRVTAKTNALGSLSYEYYANGLLKDVVSSNAGGLNTGYRYDEANRLAFVDDASGVQSAGTPLHTTGYSYNANGSLQSVSAPNGVSQAYTYDTLNRLRTLTVSTAANTLRGYAYSLNPSGHRHIVTESTGRTATYGYDGLYRLTSETVAGVADP